MPDYKIKFFVNPKKWEQWLKKNYSKSNGVWLKFYKKNSGKKSLNYAGALDVALCYGWIDSMAKRLDDKAYLQKFTPRRSRSVWSKINRKHIARLIKERRMKPAGLKQVLEAKKDGRWSKAY
jgi:uncharacterized protein YdeI (YjbR/CyaY-like superfamily)